MPVRVRERTFSVSVVYTFYKELGAWNVSTINRLSFIRRRLATAAE